ncbi:DMT family transporter [Sediminispirochaeta smaragdinae]|uniref:EamA domain-containing protein n=1 Tax=Sediminispirochaeta smaragdinae (strain DSM 11293 / JCM 15392 / SEBR 4228) TaxID=573413 RepID=E1R1X5_SEDSS|nr:DMT family transporter [Sediminispirochaeta smaragdinae]ADK81501.1 protein of unknown function DUF6 transmembrane [Sediminispirochaeta smaragdinae DSM 11293]
MILGQFFALLTAGCWAHNSIVYSAAGKRVGSRAVTHIRLWIALPVMFLLHLLFCGSPYPLGLSSSVYLFLGLSGLFGFCVADLFIFRAFVDLGPRETMVVMTLSPIFGAILSRIFLGEILSPLQMLGIAATVGGVIWVILEEGARSRGIQRQSGTEEDQRAKRTGAFFALGGAFTQAVGMFLAKAGLAHGIHPFSANLLRLSAGLIGLVLYAAVRKSLVSDFTALIHDRKALLLTANGALVGPILGIVLSLYALTWAPVGIVTALMQTSPIFLLPIDRLYFKKRVSKGAVAGTITAIVGTALLFL